MPGLTNRLELAQLSIADQDDYIEQLLLQFDMPYDACCSLQVAVSDLRLAAHAIDTLAQDLDRELRQPETPPSRRQG